MKTKEISNMLLKKQLGTTEPEIILNTYGIDIGMKMINEANFQAIFTKLDEIQEKLNES